MEEGAKDTHFHTFTLWEKEPFSWTLVAHICNSGYSGGRDQEDCGSKSAWTNSLISSILKTPNMKKGW
jgi:hypothetical protein